MGTEWLRHNEHNDEGVAMALGERIRELRKERGWSQAELGKRIGTDSQYVSRYKTGRITPSVDALVRLADILEVSTDYLVRDGAPARPWRATTSASSGDGSADLAELSEADQEVASQVIDALVAKSRLKVLGRRHRLKALVRQGWSPSARLRTGSEPEAEPVPADVEVVVDRRGAPLGQGRP